MIRLFLVGLILYHLVSLVFNGLKLWGNYFLSHGKYYEAVTVDPGNYYNRLALGTALTSGDNHHAAVLHLEKAIELNPGYVDSYNNLAGALVKQGRYDEARDVLRRLLEIVPSHDIGRKNLEQLERGLRGGSK